MQRVLSLVERLLVVGCQVGKMFADQFRHFKKVLVCSLILVGLTCQSSTAATIINLEKQQPLGATTINGAGDQMTFSLGNGRALLLSVANNKKNNGSVVCNLLLRQDGVGSKTRSVAARKLKINLKW